MKWLEVKGNKNITVNKMKQNETKWNFNTEKKLGMKNHEFLFKSQHDFTYEGFISQFK